MFGDVAFAQAPFASLGGNTFGGSVSETASVSDASTALFVAGRAVNEAVSSVAEQSVIATLLATNAEAASALDAPDTLNNIFNADIAAFASGVDNYAGTADYTVTQDEAASGLDAQSAQASYLVSISEAVRALATEPA